MRRYAINSTSVDDQALGEALAWLAAEANEADGTCAIYVATLAVTDSLARVLGQAAASCLRGGGTIQIRDAQVQLLTQRNHPIYFPHPLLVPFASPEKLDVAEAMRPTALGATGWAPGALDAWISAFGVIDIRTGDPFVKAAKPKPALVGAVRHLTFGIADDVVGTDDKDRAIQAFRALTLQGRSCDPVLVKAEAQRQGWDPDAAGRLAAIAAKFEAGNRVSGGRITKTESKKLVAAFEAEG